MRFAPLARFAAIVQGLDRQTAGDKAKAQR